MTSKTKEANCQSRTDCGRETKRGYSWLSIKFILGLFLIFAGVGLFFFGFIYFADGIPSTPPTTESIVPDDKNATLSAPVDESSSSFLNEYQIISSGIALGLLSLGLFLAVSKFSLKRSFTPQEEDVEIGALQSKRFSRIENDPSELESTVPLHSNGQASSPEKSSQDLKRPKYSNESEQEVEELISKTTVHYEGGNAPRKSDSKENFPYTRPEDESCLVLFPAKYPKETCNEEMCNKARDIAYDLIMNLKTKYIDIEDGYIKIGHLTNSTREYFQRTDDKSFISKMQSEFKKDMKIYSYSYFQKLIRLSCILEEPIEDSKFLPAFYNENQIKKSHCSFDKGEPVEDGFEIYFGVTPLCFQQIKDRDYLATIRQRLIKINVLENPYPELFDDQEDK